MWQLFYLMYIHFFFFSLLWKIDCIFAVLILSLQINYPGGYNGREEGYEIPAGTDIFLSVSWSYDHMLVDIKLWKMCVHSLALTLFRYFLPALGVQPPPVSVLLGPSSWVRAREVPSPKNKRRHQRVVGVQSKQKPWSNVSEWGSPSTLHHQNLLLKLQPWTPPW